MKGWGQDFRWAVRGIWRRPGFALVATLTIALGIGAASAVFAVVDAVVFRPLPYPEPDRLVAVWTTFEGQGDFGLSMAEEYDYAEETRALAELGSFTRGSATLTGNGATRRVDEALTWGNLYDVIGAHTTIGRLPSEEDAHTGSAPVAVVSHGFWTSDLGADPSVVGHALELDGESVEVIGVMAPGVRLPTADPSVWRPIAQDRVDITDRSGHWLEGIGRLAPGATLASLRTEMNKVLARWDVVWAGAHSPGHPGHSLAVAELHDRYFGELGRPAAMMMGAILIVLLLACANVASMLLARGEGRAGELALRRALGADRGRIVRQMLVESLVLSLVGGAAGLFLAHFGVDLVVRLGPQSLPRTDTIGLDARVTAFAVGMTLLSGQVFGLLPALRAGSRVRGTRGSVGPDHGLRRWLSGLVVGQVALSVMLLVSAGLLTRTVRALASADVGFGTSGRLTFRASLAEAAYPEMTDVRQFWDRLVTRVEAVPGVQQVALTRLLPLRDGLRREGMTVEGRATTTGEAAAVAFGLVTPDYFATLGIPVMEGREFDATDTPDGPLVGVVNRAAAEAFWPGGSPVGSRVHPLFLPDGADPVTIVGVVGDIQAEGARLGTTPELYLTYAQAPPALAGYARTAAVVARTSVAPASLFAETRTAVEQLDARVPITDLSTYDGVANDARGRERFLATLLTTFAGLALLIAGMGTYGVVAYSTARRRREFGVRLALGAARDRVVGSVLGDGVRLAALGVGVGVGSALLIGRALRTLLFGVNAWDPVSLLVGSLAMGGVVVAASTLPAIRASRVDPMESLRDER